MHKNMSESNKQNLEDASKDRQVIRKFLKKVGLSQNIDVLRGLSREERIEAQANRIEDAIKNETNETEKNKLQRILNSYKAVNETIGEFIKQNPITVKNKISNFGEVKKVYKKEIKKNEESKKEKVADVFEGENKQAFLRAQELKQSEDQIDISLNRAHLEITQGLPGSEEYFDDLLKDQSKVKEEIKNLEDTNYIEMRSAQLLSLREDLEKEGHIARVDSTKKDISFINEALLTGNPVFLHGPTGTGKTSLARFSAKELTGHKPYMIYCNPQTKESNIFGRQSIDVENGASKTYFDLGPLAKAMKDGKVCIFDEFSSLPKEQMSMIKGLLNHKVGDDVDIPGNGFVRIKQGFQIIYTANLKSDKNKERNDLPPEVANESAILNKEIKCQSPEEGYDIFLTRIMNDKGEASFSKYDLEDTIPSFLNAMKDIQEAYQGI
ncbi:MAG: hypothetical protein QG610_69, partial [Euryarchaeota archaeon]|nr:hypothetical protein [Euryarchaeota archaeon]